MQLNFLLCVFIFLMVFHLNIFNKGKRQNLALAYLNNLKNSYFSGVSSGSESVNKSEESSDKNNNKIAQNFFWKKYQRNFENNNLSENQDNNNKNIIYSGSNIYNSEMVNNNTGIDVNMMGDNPAARLEELRNIMKKNNIDVYILINSDEHNSEIINEKDKKIVKITNYSGADGILIVTKDKPILYVNALYELQAMNELDQNLFTLKISRIENRDEIFETISSMEFNTIAFDGKNTSVVFYEKLRKAVLNAYPKKKIIEKIIYNNNFHDVNKKDENIINFLVLEKSLVEVKDYPINNKTLYIHDRKFNGACAGEKIDKLKQSLMYDMKNVDNLLLSELDEIAYLLNLRGYDYEYSPLFYSYLLFQFDREEQDFSKIVFFTKVKNLTAEVKNLLEINKVIIKEYEEVVPYLRDVVIPSIPKHNDDNPDFKKYDISLSPYINLMIYKLFDKKNVVLQNSPVVNLKAVKNDIEIDNMKEAHILDGLALLQFFHWCEEKRKTKELFNETEMSLRHKVDYFRSTKKNFIFPSFSTISASGSNAAVIHYECTDKTNAKIKPAIYLLDSGGQYFHGTTDVTRTTHFGEPTPEEKRIYTLVLKGHLRLRKVIFASYTNSSALDFLARENLFNNFMDYNHGTGHGVGLTLNVHEGGCSIGPVGGAPLKKNMVLSNEPGYYMKDKFGVRIENMQYVISKEITDTTEYLSFDDLTMYPYEKKLLDFSLLTNKEIKELNEYHTTIRNTLLPLVKQNPQEYGPSVEKYLIDITEPIAIHLN
ncbi:aminopeptidase P [Plasmodium gaboni]|uniref:Aminopeptidase P n=1 Tax=Plasmodium gaboni TaxID=647221 RepID=A0A151LAZ9_9APIC|nr:aminopeptidase P [Plasmodium gaboni]KYN96133.1 aminopeptidase P [Plasmodium gaboni]